MNLMTDDYSGRALSCVWFIDANTEPGIEGASAVDILRSHVPVWAKNQDATLDPDWISQICRIRDSEQELTGDVSEMQGEWMLGGTLRGQNAASALRVPMKEAYHNAIPRSPRSTIGPNSPTQIRHSYLLSPQAEMLALLIFPERKSRGYNQMKNRYTWQKG